MSPIWGERTLALDIISKSRGHPDCSSESKISVNGDTWSLESRSLDIKMMLCRFLFCSLADILDVSKRRIGTKHELKDQRNIT
jgi:hypothetical protein